MYLTKGDLLAARKCSTKLYYRKNNYPEKNTDESFLQQLAEAGHVVKEMARVYHSGVVVDGTYLETALTLTNNLLQDGAVVFDGVFRLGKRLASIDMIKKSGDSIHLYEITSCVFTGKSPEFYNKNGTVKAENLEMFEGLAYVYNIVQKLHPKAIISAHIIAMDREKVNYDENLHLNFRTEEIVDVDGRKKTVAHFDGDPQQIKDNFLMFSYDVTEKILNLSKTVDEQASKLEEYVGDKGCKKPEPNIGRTCFGCEYRVKNEERSGFKECWKDLADAKNHILDLFSPSMQKVDGVYAIDAMIAEGKNEMGDWLNLPLSEGETKKRQKIQIENTLSNKEFFGPSLKKTLTDLSFPLHFVDFETCAKSIPYHSGQKPYQMVGFQWSMHTLHKDGTLIHAEFINDEPTDPNDRFLTSLANELTEEGTFLMWHYHESTVLKQLLNSAGSFQNDVWVWKDDNNRLIYEKLQRILEKGLVDMNKITKMEYFHPLMGSKTSIKKVLPAVWQTSPHLDEDPYLKPYRLEKFADPYQALAKDDEEAVQSGTEAIVYYDKMLTALKRNNLEEANKLKDLLLKYCHLDTLAMYIIYMHWVKSLEV